MGKEAYDDYKRYLRDREANSQRYLVLDPSSASSSSSSQRPSTRHTRSSSLSHHIPDNLNTRSLPSSSLRVGHLVLLEKNQRVPADLILLHTSDASGTCFIRTDQLDGETDWKLRVAIPETQKLGASDEGDNDGGGIGAIAGLDAEIYADAPIKDIHSFIGTFTLNTLPPPPTQPIASQSQVELTPITAHTTVSPLTAENVLWSNTVLASGSALGFVVYTGKDTRAVMNTSEPGTKVGLLDLEINRLAKVSSY